MVKYIPCYSFKDEEHFSLGHTILSVAFSRQFLFLSASDLTVFVYEIRNFEEIKCFNTLGVATSLGCDDEGNLLAAIELDGKRPSKKNATVRVYLNLRRASKENVTKTIIAGTYLRRKQAIKTLHELLPNDRTILSVELRLKDNPLAVAVDPKSANVVIGLQKRILVYAVERCVAASYLTDVDLCLVMDVEINFKAKQLGIFNEFLAASSRKECQVFKCIKEDSSDQIEHTGQMVPSKSCCRQVLIREFSLRERFKHSILTTSYDQGNFSKRSRTLARQQGDAYEEFCDIARRDKTDRKNIQNKVKVSESIGGGLKVCGVISDSSNICPKLDLLYERLRVNSSKAELRRPVTVVYIKNDCGSHFSILSTIFYQIKGSTKITYALISTQGGASLYSISKDDSVFECCLQFASTARQISIDGAHVFVLGERHVEVFTNPAIMSGNNIKAEEDEEHERSKERILINIHELPQRSTDPSILYSFDHKIMILQMSCSGLTGMVLSKPSIKEEEELLLKASQNLNERCVNKHLNMQLKSLQSSILS